MRPWCGLILPLITAALYGLIWRFDPWLENTIVGHLLIRYEMCYFTQCDNACWNIQNVHDRWITKLWITWFIRYMYFWGCDLRSLCCGSEYKWPHCITIVYFFFFSTENTAYWARVQRSDAAVIQWGRSTVPAQGPSWPRLTAHTPGYTRCTLTHPPLQSIHPLFIQLIFPLQTYDSE